MVRFKSRELNQQMFIPVCHRAQILSERHATAGLAACARLHINARQLLAGILCAK